MSFDFLFLVWIIHTTKKEQTVYGSVFIQTVAVSTLEKLEQCWGCKEKGGGGCLKLGCEFREYA